MATQHEPYRIYRALLYLYPKSHRKAYGQQMVQTLDDMLSEQQTSLEKFSVWLKVISELPVNIVEENINSMGDISVNKLSKITRRHMLRGLVAILIIGSYVGMTLLWRHQRTQINSLNTQLQTVTEQQHATASYYNAATIIPSEDSVYFPLARLKLAATSQNEELVYDYNKGGAVPGISKVLPDHLDISTHNLSLNNFSSTGQFTCTSIAYAEFGTEAYPLNPMWKSNGSVKLADGRTMNVFYAPKIPGCENTWSMLGIDSKAIADSLKQAVSY